MNASPLRVTLVDCGSRKVPDIAALLAAAGASVATVPLPAGPEASTGGGSDAVVVSGGPALFTDPEQGALLVERFRFLDTLTVPVLGICLGHQALALRAGGAVFRGPARREHETIEILEDHPLLAGLARPLHMREDHVEGVTVPAGWRRIARSAHYDNEMMAAEGAPRFGVQFHPEVSGGAGERLFANFLALVRAGRRAVP